ncbi:MAG: 50S ribosomal protein L9 [Cytophagales bacterium]|nr:50S ribosomal protein L9 [Cytophagales bacterium]MDW8384285.1 50S ribosomal protein L9 [Flammeovirgaceae bacterium]
MEVILKEDIKGLGYKNDIVKVKPGYGRNYLIPKGLAILATDSAKKMLAENLRQAQHKAERIKNEALTLAAQLASIVLEIPTKAGETGRIFGAVTSIQVAEALKEKGFEIDRKKISFKEEIKMLGEYEAIVDLHKEVKAVVKLNVINAD